MEQKKLPASKSYNQAQFWKKKEEEEKLQCRTQKTIQTGVNYERDDADVLSLKVHLLLWNIFLSVRDMI